MEETVQDDRNMKITESDSRPENYGKDQLRVLCLYTLGIHEIPGRI